MQERCYHRLVTRSVRRIQQRQVQNISCKKVNYQNALCMSKREVFRHDCSGSRMSEKTHKFTSYRIYLGIASHILGELLLQFLLDNFCLIFLNLFGCSWKKTYYFSSNVAHTVWPHPEQNRIEMHTTYTTGQYWKTVHFDGSVLHNTWHCLRAKYIKSRGYKPMAFWMLG